jgi:hypothetical protein
MYYRIAAFALITALAASTAPAAAALRGGTLLNGTITNTYSSASAYVGEPVTLSNVTNDDGSGTVVGGTLHGEVVAVQRASQGRPGKLEFRFTELVTRSGAVYAIRSGVREMKVQTHNNDLKEAGGALAGMLVGNAIGKTLFHLGGGGIAGAAGGFLLAKNNRQNVSVPRGSIVQVRLYSVTRRQSP